ncbi:MAG: hypothetical protein HYY90_00495 [Candidatus Omnitrophica bacterium]|nr:hypothetical protein [Candidatus Omnitrophota bacterium]MBI2496120.1 hypothetical protein [Candidatus Omnitrophota bacterium]MBI3020634.1 hypothetical protein [Candidatus Omnitrophota bacterium]MBI3082838.1 hypothetical protein [Candidatus Omnitrophota bacterium]
MSAPVRSRGLTLMELLIGALLLAVGIVTLLETFVRQQTLNEHARNLSWAMNDATRVMEEIRQQNSGDACAVPSLTPPAGFASWNAWLADASVNGGGGKSVQPNPATEELIVPSGSGTDPISLTVAVCWRHRGRVIGECRWDGAQLVPNDADGNGVITSPAALSTLLTCRR